MVSSMPKYRKKPVVIDAVQWDGTPRGATPIIDWILSTSELSARWDEPHDAIGPDENGLGCPASEGGLFINTLEGTMTVSPRDWVIRGVQGEFYPCKPDIFEQTYEPC
jgi:hypothetical protein